VIDSDAQVAKFLPKLEKADWIAVDTEADSLHAYPEKLCLIQLSFAGTDTLLDPLSECNLRPVMEVLATKHLIFHGADYDLRLLHRTFGFVPSAIFDTMWAARLLGHRQFGLSDLAREHLGAELEKGPQKMNWGLRPLPDRMATYALNDTRYLRPLADLLSRKLKEAGRLLWLEEVCAQVIADCARPRQQDPEDLWRIKGSDRLDSAGLALLRTLWFWREEEAVSANKPPYFILSHEKLVALSAAASRGRPVQPLAPAHLPPGRAARLASAIERALQLAPTEFPRPRRLFGIRLTRPEQARFDQLKRLRDVRAGELGLDPTVVASKADLVLLAKNGPGGKHLMDWQRELLAN
jgi:ribonuclease D